MISVRRSLAAVVVAGLAGALLSAPTSATAASAGVSHLRDVTAQYKVLKNAKADGYGKFKDAAGIACIEDDDPAMGGMGIHFVNGDLVGDAEVRADHPEALVYQPTDDGLKLVAVEYIVFRKAWRAEHPTGRPELFGQKFLAVGKDNRYGIPPFFEIHVWAWKHNPAGMFMDMNPRVSCP